MLTTNPSTTASELFSFKVFLIYLLREVFPRKSAACFRSTKHRYASYDVCYNVTRAGVEPRPFDNGHRDSGNSNHSAIEIEKRKNVSELRRQNFKIDS